MQRRMAGSDGDPKRVNLLGSPFDRVDKDPECVRGLLMGVVVTVGRNATSRLDLVG